MAWRALGNQFDHLAVVIDEEDAGLADGQRTRETNVFS